MSADFDPTPESHGALVPPVRHPPTAVGVATPPPPRPPRPVRVEPQGSWLVRAIGAGVTAVLDAADTMGDALRSAVGLERSPGTAVVRREEPPR